ncbi:MAG TPA: glucose-1-phosphate adenylyltransferase family protein [Thermoanaerobaculia bacterium]|nr:glucose-1-phosphate adenylyltransferase family protein [Thermoanaerobaculia bacterium]
MPRTKTLALILAGGAGGRLEVLTAERAKPAMPFAGVYRLIDFPLSNCLHSGVSDVWVIEQYELHSLNEHLANGRPWDLDRTYGGLQVLPPHQSKSRSDEGGFAQGNADAIYRHKSLIRELDPDLLLVLSADHVYKLDYREVIDRHRETDAAVTLVTTRLPPGEDASRFGVVEVDGAGKVTGFEYKPESPRSDLVTTEVFVYDAVELMDTLDRLADGTGGEESGLKDFGHELIPSLVQEGRAREYRLEGYWRDVGTVESYWQAHMDLLERQPGLVLDDPAWPLRTYGTQRLPARVEGTARIEGSLISPGCRIAGRVERSVLGPGVVVEEGAEVRDSVLLDEVVVGAGASIERAILDAEVRVGKGASVGERDGDLTLAGRRARIPAAARLDAGARLGPGEEA